jgi:hypothetical protein
MTGDGKYRDGLSDEERSRLVADIWNAIDCEHSCATDGVALDEFRREVTEATYKGDSVLAMSLTARVLHMISRTD